MSLRDLRALLEFLERLYACPDLHALRAHVTSGVPSLVGCAVAGVHEMRPSSATSENWFWPAEANDVAPARAWERHMHEHPVLAHQLRTGDGRAARISDFLSRREFQRLGLYAEVYRPMSVEDVLGTVLSPSPSPLALVGVSLSRESRTFGERDRLLLDLLRPHLAAAYRQAIATGRLGLELALLSDALETVRRGIALCTRDGRILRANAEALRCLTAYFGGPGRVTTYVPDSLRGWVRHQMKLLERRDDATPPRAPLASERDGARLVTRLLSRPPLALLLLDERPVGVEPESLESLGLTRREAAVLAWVAEGKTNPEIAIILGLSPRTVQTHLDHIYRKFGVETRTAAAARALAGERGHH